MHLYFGSIGFSKIKTEAELESLLEEVFRDYQKRETAKLENGNGVFLEMTKDFLPGMGIALCGILDENGFHQKYYFPYYRSEGMSTFEEVTIEKRADGETFAGVCDDSRMGVSMIFFVQNPSAYFKEMPSDFLKKKSSTTFTCLAQSGKILLPVLKREVREEERILDISERSGLINAARNGDQDAIENLTVEDMDMYSMISKRVVNEDVLSIVDTSFMPYGIECDRYQMIGTINYFTKVCNPYTGEFVYQLNLECNDMYFDVCINAEDLLGEPEEGRRFKGIVWLQGRVNYE